MVVDIREPDERSQNGAIRGAVHAPRGMVEFYADPASPYHRQEFDPTRRTLLYCASGGRSALAVRALQQLGYSNIAHLDGGLKAWTGAGAALLGDKPAMTTTDSLAGRTAERFISALARRDFGELQEFLHPVIQFRALTPRGLCEAADRAGAIAYFHKWFDRADHVALSDGHVESVADRAHLSYRLRVHDERGWWLIEQHAYVDIDDNRASRVDLLCSAFRPIDVASPEAAMSSACLEVRPTNASSAKSRGGLDKASSNRLRLRPV